MSCEKVFAERLTAFELRCAACRPKTGQACCSKVIHNPRDQRRLRSNDRQSTVILGRKGRETGNV